MTRSSSACADGRQPRAGLVSDIQSGIVAPMRAAVYQSMLTFTIPAGAVLWRHSEASRESEQAQRCALVVKHCVSSLKQLRRSDCQSNSHCNAQNNRKSCRRPSYRRLGVSITGVGSCNLLLFKTERSRQLCLLRALILDRKPAQLQSLASGALMCCSTRRAIGRRHRWWAMQADTCTSCCVEL
jgi:hypothetical protein